MMDVVRLKWKSAVDECRIHALRLSAAMVHVAERMPLDETKLDRLDDVSAAWLDQLLYRFAKLQDTLGERVFMDGLLLLGEDFRSRPFIDALNRLDALKLIPSSLWWQELRELRNQIAHEYPDRRAEQAAAGNEIHGRCNELLQVVDQFVRAVEERMGDMKS